MGRLVLVFEKVIGIKEIGKRRVGISGIGSDNTANGFRNHIGRNMDTDSLYILFTCYRHPGFLFAVQQ